jgi:hypothetical protein
MFRSKTLIIRFASGGYGIINTGYTGTEWKPLHLCDNFAHVQEWIETLGVNRRYISYRYY